MMSAPIGSGWSNRQVAERRGPKAVPWERPLDRLFRLGDYGSKAVGSDHGRRCLVTHS
jgi:hypothetical protein